MSNEYAAEITYHSSRMNCIKQRLRARIGQRTPTFYQIVLY